MSQTFNKQDVDDEKTTRKTFMSDWEEYCDNVGMDMGSSDAYDDWVDGLDGSNNKSAKIKKYEVQEPTITQNQLIDFIRKSFTSQWKNNVKFYDARDKLGEEIPLTCLHDLKDGEGDDIQVQIGDSDYISGSFLIQALKTTEVPFFDEWGDIWAIWDDEDLCVKTGPSPHEKIYTRYLQALNSWQKTLKFLRQCEISSDYGMKPVLIQSKDIERARLKQKIHFVEPKIITYEDRKDYVLAYYNTCGVGRFISIEKIMEEHQVRVSTRNGNYFLDNGVLYPYINTASLLTNAFVILASDNWQYFLIRKNGTIFQSAIQKIHSDIVEEYRTIEEFLKEITQEYCNEFVDTIYVTNGCHPLEKNSFVTTPEMLDKAKKIIGRHGFLSSLPPKVFS